MVKKKSNLLKEAVADAQEVKRRAIENAKVMLMESLEDKVERLVSEGINDVGNKYSGMPTEAEDEEELNLDELPEDEDEVKTDALEFEASEIPPEEEEEDEIEEAEDDELEQGEKETPEQKRKKAAALEPTEESEFGLEEINLDEEEDEDEEEEISDEEVEEVYKELKLNEVDELGEPDSKVNPEDHIEDQAKGEKSHEEQEPPAKQDFIPKEYFRRKIGLAGRKLVEHKRVIRKLMREMAEVNLLNAKLKSTHTLTRLTENRKTKEDIIGIIDQARSVAEVKRLEKGTRLFLRQLAESKGTRRSPLNRSTSNVIPMPKGSKKVIKESAGVQRLQELAGIIKPSVNETDEDE